MGRYGLEGRYGFVGGGKPPRERQSTSSSLRSIVSPSSPPRVRSVNDILEGGALVNDVVRGAHDMRHTASPLRHASLFFTSRFVNDIVRGAHRGMTTMLSLRRAGRTPCLIIDCLWSGGK